MKYLILIVSMFWALAASAQQRPLVAGMNLTQLGNFKYDANPAGSANKTPAQIAVDQIYELGARHVILNPQARMFSPYSNDLIPDTPASERAKERLAYRRLIDYIHSKGMTVGIRPIFFVVHPNGDFPYVEQTPNGDKVWWHGNIQPSEPDRWFESFRQFLDTYILIARFTNVEEFTIGAELYSMTVGVEDQWEKYPYGFPGKWNDLLKYVRAKLGDNVRIMYDINFTDDTVSGTGDMTTMGGELERWRYRLVDLAFPSDPEEHKIWTELVEFWNGLDAVGIDMYRSLAGRNDLLPQSYGPLVNHLKIRANQYATQIDNTFAEIEFVTGQPQYMIFKEVGYRSIEKGFIDPFEYEDGSGVYNEEHQAASFEALFEAFWLPRFQWFQGASFWDVSVSPTRNTGVGNTGFSPVGKPLTTEVLQRLYSFE